MKPLDRNISILEHIVGYCDQIFAALEMTTACSLRTRSTGMRRHCAFCKSVSWLGNSAQSTPAHPGGRSGECETLWPIAMALLTRKLLGKS